MGHKATISVLAVVMALATASPVSAADKTPLQTTGALVPDCAVQPRWSPGGGIVYARSGEWHLFDPEKGTTAPAAAPAPTAPSRTFKREFWFAGPLDVDELAAPDGSALASVHDFNVRVRAASGGPARTLTTDGIGDVSWDIGPFAAEGWSPDGSLLFALRYDRSNVFKAPQVRYPGQNEELVMVRQQKAGQPLDRAQPFLLPVAGGAPLRLDVGDTSDRYFVPLGWTADGAELLFAAINRTFNRIEVLAARRTGKVRPVMTETGQSFVRMQHEVLFPMSYGFTMLPDGFLWESERDGWNQLYHYDLNGRLVRKLTSSAFPVDEVARFDARSRTVYFTGSRDPERPYDRHLYSVSLDGGSVRQLTDGKGRHDIRFSADGALFIDSYSTVSTPPRHLVRDTNGRVIATILEADTAQLSATGRPLPEELRLKAADGKTDLYGVLYKPDGFDPGKRYPLVEYVYGGPQLRLTPDRFCPSPGWSSFPQALAQRGYVVLILDARGTPRRSKRFHDAVMGNWGGHVVADHRAALLQLASERPYIDLTRTGVMGRSWGGHFALRLLAEAPDVYKAAVSIVPSFDARAGILYEPYLGMPAANATVYDEATIFRLAPKVNGPLLLVGTTLDTSTLVDVMKMTDALIDADKKFDLLIFPEQEHQILGHDLDYLQNRIEDFFASALQPE